jgi:hypothetical protein
MLLRIAGGVAIVAAAIAATILLNLMLLGTAERRNDPLGKLSPRAVFAPAPATTSRIRPAVRTHDVGDRDD